MPCNQVWPNMALKGDRSSTNENCTFKVIGQVWTGSTMSPSDVVKAPLNPDNIRPGFSRFEGENPICLITNACKRSAELPGSTKIHLTSKSFTLNVRLRASRCGCTIWWESTEGKMIVLSIGHMLLLVKPGRMKLTCSRIETAWSSLCIFYLKSYSLSRGPPWI